MSKIPCTVEILTHNSGETLRRALESVKDFAEIIVIDGSSTDDTLAIATEYGAHIIPQDPGYLEADGRIKDFAAIRNQGLEAATQPWFFFLDSDEFLSTELVEGIRRIVTTGQRGAYWIFRKYVGVDGIVVDCATTYPNRSMRLFAKTSTLKFIKSVHERIMLKDGEIVREFPTGALFVPLELDMQKNWRKDAQYISIEVKRFRGVNLCQLILVTVRVALTSIRYLGRHIRILVFCRGVRMPFIQEADRHWYHAKLLYALWRIVYENTHLFFW